MQGICAAGHFQFATKIGQVSRQSSGYSSRRRADRVRCISHCLLGRRRHGAGDGGRCRGRRGRGVRKALAKEPEPSVQWFGGLNPLKHLLFVLHKVSIYFHTKVALSNCTTLATFAHHAQAVVYLSSDSCICCLPAWPLSDASDFERDTVAVFTDIDYGTLVVAHSKLSHVVFYRGSSRLHTPGVARNPPRNADVSGVPRPFPRLGSGRRQLGGCRSCRSCSCRNLKRQALLGGRRRPLPLSPLSGPRQSRRRRPVAVAFASADRRPRRRDRRVRTLRVRSAGAGVCAGGPVVQSPAQRI